MSLLIIAFCLYVLILFLTIALHTKHPSMQYHIINIFNIVVHEFCNLFYKIWPLFGQILIMCLKFFWSFFASFFQQKHVLGMRLQHVLLQIHTPINMINVAIIFSEFFLYSNSIKNLKHQPQSCFVSFYEKRSAMLWVIACQCHFHDELN